MIVVLTLSGTFIASRLSARAAASPAENAIAAEQHRYPLTKVDWRRRVDVPFGTVDLPGEHRTFKAQISGGDKVSAVGVGGHRRGIALAEIRYAPGASRSERVAQEADLAADLYAELGLDADRVLMVTSATEASYRGSITMSQIGDLQGIGLATTGRYEKTALRLEIVSERRRKVMIVSTWPLAIPDTVTDRVVRTVRIGG